MTVVYIDSLFLLNLLLDYLLLRVSARICGQYIPTLRLGLGRCSERATLCVRFCPEAAF